MVNKVTYGYVRTTSNSKTSILEQMSLIDREADKLGLTVKKHLIDTKDRTAYMKLIKLIEEGAVDTIIVVDKTRISRKALDIFNFINICNKHNTELIFIQ